MNHIISLSILLCMTSLASGSLRIYSNGAIVPEDEPSVLALRKLQEVALKAAETSQEDDLDDDTEEDPQKIGRTKPPSRPKMRKPVVPPVRPVPADRVDSERDEGLVDEKSIDFDDESLVKPVYGGRRVPSGIRHFRGFRRHPGVRRYPEVRRRPEVHGYPEVRPFRGLRRYPDFRPSPVLRRYTGGPYRFPGYGPFIRPPPPYVAYLDEPFLEDF
jgi:hypothetical protein